jgi:negative regulator of sigma E activity
MKHGYWLKNLSAYLDNEVSDRKRKKIELHLADCKLCQSQLAQWKKIQEIRKTETFLYPEEQVWQAISRKMRTEPVKPLRFWEDDWISRYIPSPVSAVVTAALVVLIVLGIQPYLRPQQVQQETTTVTIDQYLSTFTDSSSGSGGGSDAVALLYGQS